MSIREVRLKPARESLEVAGAVSPLGPASQPRTYTLLQKHYRPPLQRASTQQNGKGRVEFTNVHGATAVTRCRATSPLKLLNPRQRGKSAWIFSSSYGGGLVSGDEIEIDIAAGSDTRCFAGTQASTKVYRCTRGKRSKQRLRARMDENAILALIPDPIVCFADADYEQRQTFHLKKDSGLILLDWLTSGRMARGERWAFRRYLSRNDVYLDGEHVLADPILLKPHQNWGALSAETFECIGMLCLFGDALETERKHLEEEVSELFPVTRKGFCKPQSGIICAFSPLRHGLMLRIAADSTEAAGSFFKERLSFLADLLGEDPWSRKW